MATTGIGGAMRHIPITAWLLLISVLLLAAGPAAADPAADNCGGLKEKASGRFALSLSKCQAGAAVRGEALDPACATKASGKLALAFSKAEGRGGCVSEDDAAAVEALLTAQADTLANSLAPGADKPSRVCASSKLKAAGKHTSGSLSCYASGARKSIGPDTSCTDRAYEKLQSSFVKAESKGGCATMTDLADVESLDRDAVVATVAAVSPVCGDAITGPTQQCEPADDDACPGQCSESCDCVLPASCGNGVAEFPEECDDGAQADGDGCSAFCQLENASALCIGVASSSGTSIDAVLIRSDFNQPLYVTAAPLDPARLFVVERQGRIRIVNLADNSKEPTAFLDITGLISTNGEGGLLSMAFDPDYDTNRRFFLNYTNTSGHTTIARYEASLGNPNVADLASARVLLVIDQPASNHNGGQVAFGPDGYLYVGMGDGGGGGDPYENAQDDAELLGKMLRLDVDVAGSPYYAVPPTNPHYVDGTNPLELIWAKGLRNPWRFGFDRATGEMLIGDVGQGSREEIDLQPAASSGGENYGWDIFEGTVCYEPDPAPMCPAPPIGFTMPIYEYDHSGGACSLSGGYVYRGCAQPDLAGTYFYSDFCSNFIRTIDIVAGAAVNPQDRTADATSAGAILNTVASFGEDARGELYIVDLSGSVYRIEPQ